MTLYSLKPRFQALLRPAVQTLHGLGVTANQVTVAACLGSLILGALLLFAAMTGQHGWFLLLPVWLLTRMALNAIDGLLARECGQASTLGAYLNELGDVLADAALYLPFGLLTESSLAPAIVVVVLANLAEMSAVLALASTGERCNAGPLGKSDRAFLFGLAGIVIGCGIAPGSWLPWLLTMLAILLLRTIINRVRHGIAATSGRPPAAGQAERT